MNYVHYKTVFSIQNNIGLFLQNFLVKGKCIGQEYCRRGEPHPRDAGELTAYVS